MLRDLRKYGVAVKCLEETYDTSDPAAVMLRAIKMTEPEMDNRRRAKNTQMGMRLTLKEGRYVCGAAPVGYMCDRNGSKPIIKPNPIAQLVKEAFEIHSTGLYSIEKVRKLLVKKGLNIGKTAFNHMLRNPVYIGKFVIPEHGEEEEQLISAIHEPIISKDLTKEGDHEQKRACLERNLEELEAKLLKIDEMYVSCDLESDSYRRLKVTTEEEISRIQSSLAQLKGTDTNFMKYCRWGQTLLTHLPTFYESASTAVKKKILGSIFTGKLIFENGNYRTTGLNKP